MGGPTCLQLVFLAEKGRLDLLQNGEDPPKAGGFLFSGLADAIVDVAKHR